MALDKSRTVDRWPFATSPSFIPIAYVLSDSDGRGGDGFKYHEPLSSAVDIGDGVCIDIDGRTHSIYLARGTGLVWRRQMTAYAATGCAADKRIESITDRDPAGPCVPIDSIMLGVPGSDQNQGRIMSVKFTKF